MGRIKENSKAIFRKAERKPIEPFLDGKGAAGMKAKMGCAACRICPYGDERHMRVLTIMAA